MRPQQREQIALRLIGNHLDDVGQVLALRGEPDDGPQLHDHGERYIAQINPGAAAEVEAS